MFLSDADLTQLTGYRRNADRRAWLARNRIPFFVAASGKPVVDSRSLSSDPEQRAAAAVTPFGPLGPDTSLFIDLAEIRAKREPWTPGCGPVGSGIYFLFMRWALTYVGQSKRVCDRIRAHRMNRFDVRTRVIPFTRWSAIEVPERHLDDVEYYYINKYQPPYNRRWNRNRRWDRGG